MRTKVSHRYAALATLLLLSAAALAAGIFGPELEATVPFTFIVRNQEMPAGAYSVSRVPVQTAPGPLLIRNHNVHKDKPVFTSCYPTTRDRTSGGSPKLVFHRFGNHYFLAEVWPDRAAGYILPPSREELAYVNDGVEMAQVVVTVRSERGAQ